MIFLVIELEAQATVPAMIIKSVFSKCVAQGTFNTGQLSKKKLLAVYNMSRFSYVGTVYHHCTCACNQPTNQPNTHHGPDLPFMKHCITLSRPRPYTAPIRACCLSRHHTHRPSLPPPGSPSTVATDLPFRSSQLLTPGTWPPGAKSAAPAAGALQ